MDKVLGLDLGTNSIGWAIVERDGSGKCFLKDQGVNIFKEGVAYEKGVEKPAVQERTVARASRRHYFRRRLRKIELLKVLIAEGMCPSLPMEALDDWKRHKKYPKDDEFMCWQRTDDNTGKNPYADRHKCLNEKLDLSTRAGRYMVGRALYHLAQRRGFMSNRKDSSGSEDGKVKTGISELTEKMMESGCQYAGEYFYKLYQDKGKIRTAYTDRDNHVREEFNAICKMQELDNVLVEKLERAIFYQRPLKSQKGAVGKCSFERGKKRCQVSHPRFEEFRMWAFINNIKVRSYLDEDFRSLNQKEIDVILPLFFRKSSPQFDFEDIAKKIAGKGNYSFRDDKDESPFVFNYRMATTVSGCPVMTALMSAFECDYASLESTMAEVYLKGEGKSVDQVINDIWHVLVSYDSDDLLKKWLSDYFQLDGKHSEALSKARIPQGYASLSLKAIHNILPYMKHGYRYDEAVFMGNLRRILGKDASEESLSRAEHAVLSSLDGHFRNPLEKGMTKEKAVQEGLVNCLGVSYDSTRKLYHPSMIDTYPSAQPDDRGLVKLGSPRTSAVRNPMAMRALFRLRLLMNRLIEEGKIDGNTKINIEFARELNDANRRAAIARYQREIEKDNIRIKEELESAYLAETGCRIEATSTDILKYRLWEEQEKRCLYTGKTISISSFIGDGNVFDIEHTLPRSREGDDSQMNKTLCENRFNRDVKKARIPSELSNHEEILARIESVGWQTKIDQISKSIEAQKRRAKAADTKDAKDAAIQQAHYLRLQLDYWKGKLTRFTMKSVPQGFSNRQGVDIGVIGRYARLYLQTVFKKVYTVKGATTAEFRKMWGLQQEYSKKVRDNHSHHCIDAITIACIGKNEYDRWARYRRDYERFRWEGKDKPVFEKPWPTFTQDVKSISDHLLIYHYYADNMQKLSRKVVKVRGKVVFGKDGSPLYAQGDTARASLHQDTFYGAISKDGNVKYVIRKSLDSIAEKDIRNIVDDIVRQKVSDAVKEKGFKKAIADGIWMNKELGIPVKKVRLYAPAVTSPISLKKQRDLSDKDYKKDYHVANDGNYCMAIYGDVKPSFRIVNNLEAAKLFNGKTDIKDVLPEFDEKGRPMKSLLRIGTLVLLYESEVDEILSCSVENLSKRLYVITGLSLSVIRQGDRSYPYGMITLKHHQEARRSSDLTVKKGVWKSGEEYRPCIQMAHTQFKAMVAGKDFIIREDGSILFIR